MTKPTKSKGGFFPQAINRKRHTLRETQLEFGARFGVSNVAVSLWEVGKRQAPYRVLEFCLEESKWRHVDMDTVVEIRHNPILGYKIIGKDHVK